MNKRTYIIIIFTIFSSLLFSQENNVFIQRRQQALEKMSPQGLTLLQTTHKGYRFGFMFQQNSNLYYLTGMNDEGIILILSKPGIDFPDKNQVAHSLLLLDPPPEKASEKNLFFQLMQDSLKFDLVCGKRELRKLLKSISQIDVFYTNVIKKNQEEGKTILEKKLIKFIEKIPDVKFVSPTKLTASIRRIKTEQEISSMQKAIDITMIAHREAFKSMQPGIYEYQIEAVVEYIFKFFGSQQLAFETIIGAGPNSLDLHYNKGTRLIQPGDIIVMDIGCEYAHYCADITRTIPASGNFSPQQKEIYNIVLEANQEIIKNLRPGFTLAQMDSVQRAVIGKYGYEKYVRHGPTHYLGLDVHDVGDWKKPLESGCVVTVEPGIYIQPNPEIANEYWNIGVRIEDDVLITSDGYRVLTDALPKTIEKIEEIMKLDGLGNLKFD